MASGRFHSNVRRHIDATFENEYGYHTSNPVGLLEIQTVARGASILEIETVAGGASFRNQNRNHVVPLTVGDEGVSLTWQDLWVRVEGRSCRSILQGLTGYAKPGQLLAIMGPSGCGKSTLLDALAGRLSSNTRQTGEILINGHKQALAYGTSAYVTQDDTLITTLTVEEAVYYSAQLQLPDSMSKSEKKERAQVTIREMGLQDAMNTRIGGWGAKGLSGGQKRRVSICIELLTRPKLLFLDEPTSGLDSAASYYVMSRIANLGCHKSSQRTIVASIHQPSSEVFQLFDNLCLLSSGRTVYFGPASAANEFFASSGFPCPTLQNPSDHFLKTINKDFEQDIEKGMAGTTPAEEAIDTLIKSYKSSENYHQLQRHIAELHKKNCEALERRSHAGFLTQSFVLTRRSFVNMYRDRGYYWLRLVIYTGIAVGLGVIYHDLGHTYRSIQARGSMLSFIASFLTFMAIGGFPSFVEDMKVFERERLNGHYGVSAFVFGNTFSSVPFLMLISLIPGATAYYLARLHSGFEHFFYFASALFACIMLVESLMMIIASIVPNYLMGIIAGAGIQGVMILCGGFFQLPNDLPDVLFKYPLYHIAFHKYAFQGMFKNEFSRTRFPNDNLLGMSSSKWLSGERILKDKWQVEMGYSKWVDLAILLGMVVLYRILFFVIIKTTEKVKTITSALLSVAPKRSMQVLVNPSSTPLHG
ncbi:ABC transporter G family member 1-like [Rosa rugosa]|uniref:ABC transporter G family member 1-like n=1 Tax=Rosa rugosa TaxID=74645 RepID=UPI002B40E897|nr:ABC transporter G family member 1-like [Rosa rugosa]